MLFSNHDNRLSTATALGYLVRVAVLGVPAFVLLSFLCRPVFAGVSISPEAVVLAGDQTIQVTARVNTRLPVVVNLIELSDPFQSKRKPNQAQMWSGKTIAQLARQPDGTFATSVDLKQRQPATRYFKITAHYAFPLSLPRLNGEDLRVGVSQHPLSLPPDPGQAGKQTLEGIDSDHDGVRDDLQREIFFLYPGNDEVRIALTAMIKKVQLVIVTEGDHEHFKELMVSAFAFQDCYNYLAFGIGFHNYTNIHSKLLWDLAHNTPERRHKNQINSALATPFSSENYFDSTACNQPLVQGQY